MTNPESDSTPEPDNVTRLPVDYEAQWLDEQRKTLTARKTRLEELRATAYADKIEAQRLLHEANVGLADVERMLAATVKRTRKPRAAGEVTA